MAVWLHKTMCSSFSFICNRPENPEHSWGYQTVLLCYLLCGRLESRLGAQVSTQELCKTQCNLGFIGSERTWMSQYASRIVLLQSTSHLPSGSCIFPWLSFKEWCKYNPRDVRLQKKPAPWVQRYLPWRSACLEATIQWNWDKQAYPLNPWLHF